MSRRKPISYLLLLLAVASDQDSERGGERRELRRDDEFRGGRRAELLEGVQVLEGHRRDALDGRPDILDVQERIPRFEDLLVDEEVDRDGRVVLRDAGLLRDLHEELAQVHSLRDKLDRRREQEYETWTANPLELAEREDHQALILGHDMHDRPQDENRDDQDDDQGD